MMKIRVDEASGYTLDWLVSRCEGWKISVREFKESQLSSCKFSYSTVNSKAGPIIDRELIGTSAEGNPGKPTWVAALSFSKEVEYEAGAARRFCSMRGPSRLVAAMRCYVASKMGDVVEVPEELLK